MPKIIEFQGKSVENALKNASVTLQIPVDEINHEIITYGSTGIFGIIGVKKAIIKVFLEGDSLVQDPKMSDLSKLNLNNLSESDVNSDSPFIEDISEIGKNVLRKIVDAITDNVNIDVLERSGKMIFNINGGNGGVSGILIGRRGQTLEAIQYIVEKVVNKKSKKRIKVIIDVEGYLKKREESLRKLAMRLVEKAKRIQKPVTIGQMNAHDRRIVHIHLRNEYDVKTQSFGSGYYRKLIIFPKKNKK